ncbi:alpha/beta hydrolase domain-containing protein 17B-like [Oppia nitens]|uniref:alpha/beta hydrolase domain-containing protein 17B-like n=1 Tax=Oppia nitens TaxID=1686743 RepID=UPI0023DA9B9A|nr:alpha/beta hydrolase domain-containing protein 17B-like [Oppia nitens]
MMSDDMSVIAKLISLVAFCPPIKSSYKLLVRQPADNTDNDNNEDSRLYIDLTPDAKLYIQETKYRRYRQLLQLSSDEFRYHCFRTRVTANGNRLIGLIVWAPKEKEEEGEDRHITSDGQQTYTIVYSHSNGSDLGLMIGSLHKLSVNCRVNVCSYDYSGYGMSDGRPSERNIYADIETVVKHLIREFRIDPKHIILYGESIGSVPTIHLSASGRMSVAGVILAAPIKSGIRTFCDYQGRTYTFDPFPNIEKIGRIDCPVLVIHGMKDRVISIAHGISLYKASKHKVSPLWLPEANHGNVRLQEPYFERII